MVLLLALVAALLFWLVDTGVIPLPNFTEPTQNPPAIDSPIEPIIDSPLELESEPPLKPNVDPILEPDTELSLPDAVVSPQAS